jgi:hypothetical protein
MVKAGEHTKREVGVKDSEHIIPYSKVLSKSGRTHSVDVVGFLKMVENM